MEPVEVTVFAADVSATESFFERLLGHPPEVSSEGASVFVAGGVDVLVHETYEPAGRDLPPEDHVAFAVDDLDDELGRIAGSGTPVVREPAGYEWGRSAYLRDPEGRLVEITER